MSEVEDPASGEAAIGTNREGNVRLGAGTGDPAGRHCANLGHKQDDESGLIYMRARYYEPTSGRFVSEDLAMDGWNWFVYCGSNPVDGTDPSGRCKVEEPAVAAMLQDSIDASGGAADAAAKKWGKDKILDACSYWAGEIFGELLSQEIEGLWGQSTSRGFGLGDENGSIFFDFDGTAHGGKCHVDTYGNIKYRIQSMCKSCNYRLDLFMKGFEDALIP